MIILPAPIDVQTEDADKEIKEWVAKTTEQLKLEAEVDPSEATAGLRAVQDGIARTASAAERLDVALGLERAVGKFGDLKDIIEKTGVSVFGLSESTVSAASAALDMSQKFASFGSMLGPIGLGVGAVVGGLVGYISKTNEATTAVKELTAAQKAHQEQLKLDAILFDKAATLAEKFGNLVKASGEALGTEEAALYSLSIGDLTDKISGVGEEIQNLIASGESSKQTLDELTASANANAEAIAEEEERLALYTRLLGESITKKNQAQKALDLLTKEVKSNTAAKKADAEVDAFALKLLEDQQKAIKAAIDQEAEWAEASDKFGAMVTASDEKWAAEQLKIAEQLAKEEAALQKAMQAETQRIADETATLQEQALAESVAQYEQYASIVAGIFGELSNQFEENIANNRGIFEGMGAAAEKGVGQALKALGKLWGAKAIGELAEGIAALTNPVTAAKAPGHFLAAAKYGAASIAAGVGGAALSGDASRRSGGGDDGGGSSGGGSTSGTGNPQLTDPGPTQHPTLYVTIAPNGIVMGDGEDSRARVGAMVTDALDAYYAAGPSLKRRG